MNDETWNHLLLPMTVKDNERLTFHIKLETLSRYIGAYNTHSNN